MEGGGREGENENKNENLKKAPLSAGSLVRGLIPPPWDNDLIQIQESDAQSTEALRHPEVTL